MTAISTQFWADFGTGGPPDAYTGFSMLPAERVVTPNFQAGDKGDAVLLIDDPGIPVPLFATHGWAHHYARRVWMGTGGGASKLVNVFWNFHDNQGHFEKLPVYAEVELAGLGGDFAVFNGTFILQRGVAITGWFYRWAFIPVNHPAGAMGRSQGPYLAYSGIAGSWLVQIRGPVLNDPCQKRWRLVQPLTDAEGVYTEGGCTATDCVDPTSCALSVGATCRVRWAGATWV